MDDYPPQNFQQNDPSNLPSGLLEKGKNKKLKYWGIGIGVLFVLGLILICIIGIFTYLNFGSDPLVKAVPPDVKIYANFDLLKLADKDVSNIAEAFSESSDEGGFTKDDLIETLDESLDELDLTFAEDIAPWIGQYIAVSMTEFSHLMPSGMVFYVQVRNTAAADEFLEKLIDGIEDSKDISIDESKYKGVKIYEIDNSRTPEKFAFARSGKILLLSTDSEDLEDAIDAQKGKSLAQDSDFKKVSRTYPKNRIASIYFKSDILDNQPPSGFDYTSLLYELDLDIINAVGVTFSVVKNGIFIDTATVYDLDELTKMQKTMLEAGNGAKKMAGYFPKDTIVYFGGNHLDFTWQFYRDLIMAGDGLEDFDESMAMLEAEIGFNLDQELIPILDGEYGVSIYKDKAGILSEETSLPVGIITVIESSNPEDLLNYAYEFEESIAYQSALSNIKKSKKNDMNCWELINPFSEDTELGFGVQNQYLLISTNVDEMQKTFNRTRSLKDSSNFKSAWSVFSKDMSPVLYIDVENGLKLIRDMTAEADIFVPIKSLVIGASKLKGDIVKTQIQIMIKEK